MNSERNIASESQMSRIEPMQGLQRLSNGCPMAALNPGTDKTK